MRVYHNPENYDGVPLNGMDDGMGSIDHLDENGMSFYDRTEASSAPTPFAGPLRDTGAYQDMAYFAGLGDDQEDMSSYGYGDYGGGGDWGDVFFDPYGNGGDVNPPGYTGPMEPTTPEPDTSTFDLEPDDPRWGLLLDENGNPVTDDQGRPISGDTGLPIGPAGGPSGGGRPSGGGPSGGGGMPSGGGRPSSGQPSGRQPYGAFSFPTARRTTAPTTGRTPYRATTTALAPRGATQKFPWWILAALGGVVLLSMKK